jgi:PAS domain S-box-containing protein
MIELSEPIDMAAPGATAASLDEATLRLIADNLPALCWVADADGAMLWYNRRWHEFTGIAPAEAAGWGWRYAIAAELLPAVVARWTRALATGEPDEITFPLRGADGAYRHFLTRVQPLRDGSGRAARWLGLMTEISDQVATEERLRRAEARNQFLLDLSDRLRRLSSAREIITAAEKELGRYLGASRVGYGELDATERYFHVDSNWTDGSVGTRVGIHDLAAFGPEVHGAIRRGAMLVIHDAAADPRIDTPEMLAAFEAMQARAVVTATLKRHGRAVSALYIHDRNPRVWTDEELSVVRDVAARTWDATERARTEQMLRESEARFRRIADSTPTPMWVTRLDRHREFVNRAYVDFLGISYEEAVDFDWRQVIHPDDMDRLLAASVAGEASLQPFALEGRYRRGDGQWRWLRSESQPRWGADGELRGFIGVAHDVTEAKEAEVALRASEARQRAINDTTPDCIKIVAADGRLLHMNPAGLGMIGAADAESAIGSDIFALVAPEHRDRWVANHARVIAGERLTWEFEVIGLSGERRHMETSAVPLPLPDGSIAQLSVARDVGERKRAEQHQRLLINELNHRVKNTLAIVQGIAQQTFKGSEAQARAAFEGRLAALAAAHNILTDRHWEAAPFRRVVENAVTALGIEPARVAIDGPDIALPPKTAISIAMAIHELATNALKYGSLSTPAGRVALRWTLLGDRLALAWRERDGPPVAAPKARGFGTRMIERGLAAELGGDVAIDFRPDGLVCTIDAPLPRPAG